MSIVQILDSYSTDYWDFKNTKSEGIHKIANYPASMVAPMQHELLQLLVNENPTYRNMLEIILPSLIQEAGKIKKCALAV